MKTKLTAISIITLLVMATSLLAQKTGEPVKKEVNTANSKIEWIGKKPTGEHTGNVKLSSGTLLVEKNEIKGGSFIIDLNSIVDLDLKDENMNSRLVGHLKSADFFDVAKYPQANFVITRVTKLPKSSSANAAATHKIEGDLTMKSITKRISFDATIGIDKGKVTASTKPFTINRTNWGVNYQSKSIFAELKDQFIDDDITLTIYLASE
jgi:polyisoprenoid-binding protein YceI